MVKISLIIPTYRPGGIDVLLGSLKNQTMRDYELILVDDLYGWRQREVKEYAETLNVPLIHVPGLPNKRTDKPFGLATAWNIGLRHAEGDYIMVGQDFLWLNPDCFERHMKLQCVDNRVTVGYMPHCVAPPLGDLKGKLTVFDKIHEEKPTQIELPDIRFRNIIPLSKDCNLGGFKSREDFAKFYFHLFNCSFNLMPNAVFPHSACLLLNGFDERMDIGHGFQDDNFIFRLNLLEYECILDRKNVMYHITHPWSRKTAHADGRFTYFNTAMAIVHGFASLKAPNGFDLIQERVRIRYEKWLHGSNGVEQPPRNETYQQPGQQLRINWIIERCKGVKSVLDLGCSNGYILRRVDGQRKTGFDINKNVLEENKKSYPHITWMHGDITKPLPFKDNEYEVVLATEVLEHIPFFEACNVIMKALRVASDRVIITIPNATTAYYNRKYVEAAHHQWACTNDKLYALSLIFLTGTWKNSPNFTLAVLHGTDPNFLFFDLKKRPKKGKSEMMKRAEQFKKMKEQEAQKIRSKQN